VISPFKWPVGTFEDHT